MKILRAATKTQCSQINKNKYIKKKEYILTSHPMSLFPSGLNSNNNVNFSHREEIISK